MTESHANKTLADVVPENCCPVCGYDHGEPFMLDEGATSWLICDFCFSESGLTFQPFDPWKEQIDNIRAVRNDICLEKKKIGTGRQSTLEEWPLENLPDFLR